MAWNPSQYLRYSTPRLRPALDLISQTIQSISLPENVRSIVDCGCGPGNITSYLHKSFPNSRIHGIDSSESMINIAKQQMKQNSTISYELSSIQDFSSKKRADTERFDIIYSNAALHWLPNHDIIMQQLIQNTLSQSSGVLAVQMPDTKNQLSHLLMETAALRSGLMDKIRGVRIPRASYDVDHYFHMLSPLCKEVNIWSTEYLQQLKHAGSSKQAQHPVLEFTKSTGLLPILEAIGGETSIEGKKFILEYDRLLYEKYPITQTHSLYTHGESIILFPFRRLFIVCRV